MSKKTYRIGIDARIYQSKYTGIGRYNFELIQHLAKIDTENTYVIFLNNPEYEQFTPPGPNFEKVLADSPYYSVREQYHFPGVLRKAKLDLMHFTHFNNPLLYFGKQVYTFHDLTPSFFPGKKNTKLIHRLGYNLAIRGASWKAKHIIAVSKNTKSDLMKVLHTPEKKISVVYEGASQGFHKKLEKAALIEVMQTYNLTKEYLLYAGVWRDHKNVVGLIRAFDTLVRKYGYQGDLVITGRKDPKYHEVIETREDLGLQERVHFVGLVPDRDLIGLFQGATAFVFPTFYEGFGIPALEAFAMGTPLVCSNTSCLPEVCGNAAEYFDPYNQADMAKAIKRVVESPERQEELIAKGKEQLQKYSWDSMAKEIHSIYLSCLS